MFAHAKRMTRHLASAGFISALCLAQAQAANLVANGDFEAPDLTATYQCFNDSTLSAWKSTPGAGHGSCYINGGAGGWPAAFSGAQYLYVNDYADAGTGIQQSVLLTAGSSYALTFALSTLGSSSAGLNVTFGTFAASIAPLSSAGWGTYSFVYTPALDGAATLKFTSAAAAVVLVDAVAVNALPVPEPASALLLAGGIGALALASRRRAR